MQNVVWYLHLKDGCRVSHLSSVSDRQSVVGDLKVELLKVDLDHLRFTHTHGHTHQFQASTSV